MVRRVGGGGIESFLRSVNSVDVSSFRSSLHAWNSGITYPEGDWPHHDPRSPIGLPGRARALLRCVRRIKPDIVHFHAPEVLLFGTPLVRVSGVPARIIHHLHAEVHSRGSRTPIGWLLARYVRSQCSRVIACSQRVADQYPEANRGDFTLSLLYNPVDANTLSCSEPLEGFREQVCSRPDEVMAVFLGRLSVHTKGLDVLCDAIRLLPEDLPLRAALVGPGDLDAVREELQPPDSVVLTGPATREDVPGLLRACDISLQPSRSEAFGISIIEAMAAGLPVIASRVGGIPEAVEDGVTGILVEPEDAEALAEAIRWMVENPEEREEMGRRGQERAKHFDVNTIAAQLEEIYYEVLDD